MKCGDGKSAILAAAIDLDQIDLCLCLSLF
jgi:hypothetical protein